MVTSKYLLIQIVLVASVHHACASMADSPKPDRVLHLVEEEEDCSAHGIDDCGKVSLLQSKVEVMKHVGSGMLHQPTSTRADSELETLAYKYGTDKSKDDHNYVALYNLIFGPIRQQVTSFLEVGVASGQSLQMWRDYFPNAEILGLDCCVANTSLVEMLEQSPRVKFLNGSSESNSSAALRPLHAESIDILIDDGDHSLAGQQKTLDTLWQYVRPGGYYIIEDVAYNINGATLAERSKNPFLHPEMLTHRTTKILQSNDAFLTDTSLGHRAWGQWTQVQKQYLEIDRDRHDSHQVVIRKRDTPLPEVSMGGLKLIG